MTRGALLLALLSAMGIGSAAAEAPKAYLQRPALIFELDQGLGNGPVANDDVAAIQRMAESLKAFRPRFEVYALLPAASRDRAKLADVLDALRDEDTPFLLEAQSSDTLVLNDNAANAPYDASHGFGASVAQLEALRQRYGGYFAGIRFHEVFGTNQQMAGCRLLKANWCDRYKRVMPSDSFFQKSLIAPYVAFAHRNAMFALFGDTYWAANYDPRRRTYDGQPYFSAEAPVTPEIFNDVIRQPQNERDLQALAARYPDTLVALYDNNDGAGGVDSSAAKIDTWADHILRPLIASGGFRGFGLSDQSWLCPDRPYNNDGSVCPVAGLIDWAKRALAKGALVIETEPGWYWFQIPTGAVAMHDYTQEPKWERRGDPAPNLIALAKALGVKLEPAR